MGLVKSSMTYDATHDKEEYSVDDEKSDDPSLS